MAALSSGHSLKALAFTLAGIERLALAESMALCPKAHVAVEEPGVLSLDLPTPADAVRLCYGSRLLEGVMLECGRIPAEYPLEGTEAFSSSLAESATLAPWLKDRTFKVVCGLSPSLSLSSTKSDVPTQELAAELGAAVLSRCASAKVRMENPDVLVKAAFLSKSAALGIDLCGIDLSRRDYRVFDHSRSVRSTVAAAASSLARIPSKGLVVDPFGRAGVVLIEAALAAARLPVHAFQKEKLQLLRLAAPFSREESLSIMEKMDSAASPLDARFHYQDPAHHFVAAAKKNAKLAGVDKALSFSRTEVSWMDLHFKEGEVAAIITHIPTPGKTLSAKEAGEILSELFYQAAYVLAPHAPIVLISPDAVLAKPAAEKHGFKLEEELPLYQGMLPLTLQRWVKA